VSDFKLIADSEKREILNSLGTKLINLHQDRLRDQVNVDGSSFAPLKPSTIKQKTNEGGTPARNAEKRMLRSEDFRKFAFEFKIDKYKLTFFISDKIHMLKKIANKRKAWETNKIKGRNQKKAKPTYGNAKGVMTTYKDIAMYNLEGDFGTNWRSSYNAGAAFFGLSESEANDAVAYMKKRAIKIAKNNLDAEIKRMVNNAKSR
jgi:hypothetical protein